MDLQTILNRGRNKQREEHQEGEADKLGTLRGGSAGIFTADGKIYGSCPRMSYLRQKGIQVAPEPYTDLMFAAGYASEDIVAEELKAAGIPFKQEEEAPVRWTTENGTVVSGRPDFVLTDEAGNMTCGLELKLISSIWTAKSVMAQLIPKSDHMIQAGHYSWQHQVPWKIVYANRAYWHINYNKWLERDFNGSIYCEHKEGRPFRVTPGYIIFDLDWTEEGVLQWKPEGGEEWTPTAITKESIEAYYEAVSRMEEGNVLPPRPEGKSVDGSKSYKPCDYCDLAEVCDSDPTTLADWKDKAVVEVSSINKERKL
ncbi:hypothetical protein OAF54_00230 [bacterium]|nr:hypothetical protein [bacterium]